MEPGASDARVRTTKRDMTGKAYPLPERLDLLMSATVCLTCATALILAGRVESFWALAGLAACYAVVMNTGYAIIHEAEHDLLHPDKKLNHMVGALVSIF